MTSRTKGLEPALIQGPKKQNSTNVTSHPQRRLIQTGTKTSMQNQADYGIAKNLQQMGLKPAFDERQKEGKFKINCLATHNSQERASINNVTQVEESQ